MKKSECVIIFIEMSRCEHLFTVEKVLPFIGASVLGRMCSAVLGHDHVHIDGGPGRGQDQGMQAFMQAQGAGLPHIPDIDRSLLVEVKTFEALIP